MMCCSYIGTSVCKLYKHYRLDRMNETILSCIGQLYIKIDALYIYIWPSYLFLMNRGTAVSQGCCTDEYLLKYLLIYRLYKSVKARENFYTCHIISFVT